MEVAVGRNDVSSYPTSAEQANMESVGATPSISIKDMEFGAVDANNEFGNIGSDLFQHLFCVYPGFSLKKVLEGKVRFICGDKGTGKTMLLRYAEIAAREQGCATTFLRYRRDVTEIDRDEMARAGQSFSNETKRSAEIASELIVTDFSKPTKTNQVDYTIGWKFYLIKLIVSQCRKLQLPLFEEDSIEWRKLVDLLDRAYGSADSSGVQRLLPEIRKGQVTLKTKHAKLGLEFSSRTPDTEEKVPFSKLAQRAFDLYRELTTRKNGLPFYILIDEIELSYRTSKAYERDARFIGDLIRAVDELDDISRDLDLPVRIILALRNQVIDAVGNIGYEINKGIEDYGILVDWRSRTGETGESPLLGILERRVSCNLPDNDPRRNDIWGSFFPPKVGKLPIKRYILNQTWSKPRDIIRLLKTLQDSCGDATRFDEQLFISIRREYSKRSWREIEEELSARHQQDFIKGIGRVLTGIHCPFRLGEFREKYERETECDESVKKMAKNTSALELLELLFEFGVVGNVGDEPGGGGIFRFSSYGEVEMAKDAPFTVHYPLRSRFAIR